MVTTRTTEACSYCKAEATDYFEIPRTAIAAGTLDADDRIFPVCPRHLVICNNEYAAFMAVRVLEATPRTT